MNWEKYFKANKLDNLFNNYRQNTENFSSIYASVNADNLPSFPPDFADLARLHYLIRTNFSFTVLEFGVGFSTLVIADALRQNYFQFKAIEKKVTAKIRNKNLFKLFSVDSSEKWINRTQSYLPDDFKEYVNFSYSPVDITLIGTEVCSLYSKLPDIVPDFIYLDAPNPKDVQGNINGLSFNCDERTIISADILLYESSLIPGAVVLIDGRTNNAHFLRRNLKRSWQNRSYREGDVSLFKLKDQTLGEINRFELNLKRYLSQNNSDLLSESN